MAKHFQWFRISVLCCLLAGASVGCEDNPRDNPGIDAGNEEDAGN